MRSITSSNRTSNSVRWAFNSRAWHPTEEEWMFAAQCVQQEEKSSIEKFVFQKDAKSSMAGQLMIRKFIHLANRTPYSDIKTLRDERNKPYLPNSNLVFNVSHQGLYTVLAGEVEPGCAVGVDIMHLERRTGHKLSEFFRLMSRTFALEEWETINSSCLDKDRIAMFFRHWCLKESYVKAIGIGITLDLRRIRFNVKTKELSKTKACVDTDLFVDGKHQLDWRFEEWLLDEEHCVAVALSGKNEKVPVPFKILNWDELSEGIKPIIPPDPDSAHSFIVKDESPEKS